MALTDVHVGMYTNLCKSCLRSVHGVSLGEPDHVNDVQVVEADR